jgi:dTDP-4-amino-4,6-dideoxygalactose transaminase
VDLGSSFVPSDLLSAITLAQLNQMDEIHRMRQAVWERYQEGLRELELRGEIILPFVRPKAEMNWHIDAFPVTDPRRRNSLLGELKRRGIGATFHYVPLHSSPYASERWGYRPEDVPITERVAASLVQLPIYPDLSQEDQGYIIESLYEILLAHQSTHLVPARAEQTRQTDTDRRAIAGAR